jgi:hypothetical protein
MSVTAKILWSGIGCRVGRRCGAERRGEAIGLEGAKMLVFSNFLLIRCVVLNVNELVDN